MRHKKILMANCLLHKTSGPQKYKQRKLCGMKAAGLAGSGLVEGNDLKL